MDTAKAPAEDAIRAVCAELADMLVAKNRAYGDSALKPLRVFSRADEIEQILVRLDDKLSRLARGSASGEDVEWDLMGYLVLLRIARRRAVENTPADVVRTPRVILPCDGPYRDGETTISCDSDATVCCVCMECGGSDMKQLAERSSACAEHREEADRRHFARRGHHPYWKELGT